MTQEQAQVRCFMQKAGQKTPKFPTIPDYNTMILRLKLIREEFEELNSALFRDDLVEIADAIGDLLVVTIGTAVAYGIDIDPIFQEIHVSNMTKFIDGHRREDGKWIKGPSYIPANLKPILDSQTPR